jgi:NADH-quinone oxidoreductase subunit K
LIAVSPPAHPSQFLALGALLFCVGVYGFLRRRNALIMFMSIELMLNAVNLTFVTFSKMRGELNGQVLAFFVIVVAAAEAVVGLAIIVSLFRRKHTTSSDDASGLRW